LIVKKSYQNLIVKISLCLSYTREMIKIDGHNSFF